MRRTKEEFIGSAPQAKNAIDELPNLFDNGVAKATSLQKTYGEDEIEVLLGSLSLMSKMTMTMIEQEEVLKIFEIYGKRQVQIASSQAVGNATDAAGFGEDPILGKTQEYEAPEDLRSLFP